MKPMDVNENNASEVWNNLYGRLFKMSTKYKFQVGDQVKISKHKRLFQKVYLPSWTEETFYLEKVIKTPKHLFRIEKKKKN